MQIGKVENNKTWWLVFSCWAIATFATLGSLFFSEVMEFPPCVLCWYQRIAMYPLVLIFLVGSFQPVRSSFAFSLPLVLVGWITAIYHLLLLYGIIPETASPCMQGVSCSTDYINWLGFITIPLLSFTAFSLLLGILSFLKVRKFYEK
jgi:disulfide bond formation protein DsbB